MEENNQQDTECKCLRGRSDCTMISAIPSSDLDEKNQPISFICVGYNRKEDRAVKNDRFTHCWKNQAVDERTHWDRRDLIDTVAVMAQALHVDENIMVSEEITTDEMNEREFLG